jgi:DNA polymerase III subunit gamma/tau
MSYLILARKYRPQTFEDMVGQRSVVQTLQNAIRTKRVTQAYLFSGMRGTGKTTTARILAKALNCVHGPTPTPCNACEECVAIVEDRSLDVLEIDGASSGGIDQIRTLRESLKYKPIHSRTKVIIIDEVHQVTGPAFNALLKTLEEPPANTVFIFATTEFNKVPATIVSRCQHFEFKKISRKEIINHLMDIAKKENITISPNGLGLIADASEGSLRDAQSLLDQAVAFSGEVVNDEELKEILGSIAADLLYEGSSAILGGTPDTVFPFVDRLVEGGTDLRVFFKEFIEHFRNLLLVRSVDDPRDILSLNGPELERLRAEAGKASAEDLLRHLLALQQAEAGLRYSSHPRIFLESLLIKLCHFRKLVPLADLLAEVEALQGPTEKPAGPGPSPSPRGGLPAGAVPPAGAGNRSGPASETQARPRSTPALAAPAPRPAGPAQAAGAAEAKSLFSRFLEGVQKEKPALAAILAQYSSFGISEDSIEIVYEGEKKFYGPTVRRDTNLVERIASDVAARPMRLRLIEREGSAPQAPKGEASVDGPESALKDPTVRFFMDTFKAKVVSVDPVKKPAEEK